MRIGDDLARFLEGPVMIILGTADAAGRPEIGRAIGIRVVAAQGRIELVVSGWQWPGTVANLRATERLAATFSRPADYVTYQLKGRAALREADEDDLRLADGYRTRTQDALDALGLSPGIADHWLAAREAVVLRLAVEQAFVQTPGPAAGSALGSQP